MTRGSTPWNAEDLLRFGASTVLALVISSVGWWHAAGEANPASQVQWVNLSVAGLLIAVYANVTWLLRGRRLIGERRARLLPNLDPTIRHDATQAAGAVATEEQRPVAGPRLALFHRPGCPLTDGSDSDWQTQERVEHERAGRRPCGVCRP